MPNDLLAQIRANLDDDGPRLVYADELQASGDPRGELIAVQCELARLGYATRPPSWDWVGDALIDPESIDQAHVRKLRKRENALLKAHEAAWAGTARTAAQKIRFERGFVAHAEIDAAKAGLPARLAALFDAAPMLESLSLAMLSRANPGALFEHRSVADQIRVLDMPVFGARPLADQKATALRDLQLRGNPDMGHAESDREAVRLLVSRWSSVVANVVRLAINDVGLVADDLANLLAVAKPLDELQLRQNDVGVAGAETLAKSPKAKSLRVLSLLANGLGAEGTAALASSAGLAGLRALDLRKNKIGVEGARALGKAFPELRTLDLTGNTLGAKGVDALANGPGLGKVRELCLQQTGMDDEALEALAGSKLLAHVRVLSLRSNKITDAGAAALAKSPAAKNLVQVNLNNNKIGAAGKKALAGSKHLGEARVLA